MGVFYSTDKLPEFRNAVLTIGTFDGVHLGHQKILKTVTDEAQKINGESIVLTFHPHPRKLLFPQQQLEIITPLEEKINFLSSFGIDHVIVVPFTKEFSQLSAKDYIRDFLVGKFHPHTVVIGYDHHFGSDRSGNITLLKAEQKTYNYQLIEIPEQLIDEAGISSTKIRKALLEGDVKESAAMMGRFYSLKGTVVKGKQLGRTIGYPTANIQLKNTEQLLPAIGVYAVKVNYENALFGGMLSIGYNPTVTEEKTIKIEVNIFEFNREIYGEQLEILFLTRMRGEEKFASLDDLKKQLQADEHYARQLIQNESE